MSPKPISDSLKAQLTGPSSQSMVAIPYEYRNSGIFFVKGAVNAILSGDAYFEGVLVEFSKNQYGRNVETYDAVVTLQLRMPTSVYKDISEGKYDDDVLKASSLPDQTTTFKINPDKIRFIKLED